MNPALKPLGMAIICASSTVAFAQTPEPRELTPLVISASRFAEDSPIIPANITLIDQQQIAASPARNLPDLLKIQAGVDIRSLYGNLGLDASVDIRGIGEAGGSNTLVLVDGQRLNPVDMGSIKWESIPLTAIDHIEIIRGSGSVLYGDRAASGVINIVTRNTTRNHLSAGVEVGSYGYTAVDVAMSGAKDGWSGKLFVNSAHTDGWRDNSDADRTSVSGGVAYDFGKGNAFLDFSAYQQEYGAPSSLSKTQYLDNPRMAATPNYRLDREGWRLRPGTELAITETLKFAIDGSIAQDTLESHNKDWFYRSERKGDTYSLSPRLKWSHGLPGAVASNTVFGIDYYNGDVRSDTLNFNNRALQGRTQAKLTNYGVYAQNSTQWGKGFDSTIGVRQQHFKEEVSDQFAGLNDGLSDHLTAWEIGGGYQVDRNLRAYLKAARNFRLPNTDELFAYDCSTWPCATLFNGTLKPQTGHLKEAGLQWDSAALSEHLAVFQQDNENEIGYIAANGKNANLDPLRRRGIESETRWKPLTSLTIGLNLTFIDARFTEGNYDGKWVPLVPKHKEALSFTWDSGKTGLHTIVVNNVGNRYFGSDFTNTREKLDAFTTVDYQALWKLQLFNIGFRLINLTDTKYSPTGYSGKYYPADRRSAFLSLNYAY